MKYQLSIYIITIIVCTFFFTNNNVVAYDTNVETETYYQEEEIVLENNHVEEEQEAFTIDGDESVDAEAASAYVKEKARKEESEKALKRVFAACTDACSLTTAGIKLRETMEKNWEFEKQHEIDNSIINDQKIAISQYEEELSSLKNRLGAEEANHNELQSEYQRKSQAYSDLETDISMVKDKIDVLEPENERLTQRILELESEKLHGLNLLEQANDVISNLKAENVKIYNELKDLNVQMEAQKAKQNLIANFEATLAQIHNKISDQIVELNETKESRVKDRDQFLQEQLEFKKYSEEKQKMTLAKQEKEQKEKMEREAIKETVVEGNDDTNTKIVEENNDVGTISSIITWMFENFLFAIVLVGTSLYYCSTHGNIWLYQFDKFMKPRTVRSRNDNSMYSSNSRAGLMPTPRRGSREEIQNFTRQDRNVILSPMRQRFK